MHAMDLHDSVTCGRRVQSQVQSDAHITTLCVFCMQAVFALLTTPLGQHFQASATESTATCWAVFLVGQQVRPQAVRKINVNKIVAGTWTLKQGDEPTLVTCLSAIISGAMWVKLVTTLLQATGPSCAFTATSKSIT